MPWPRTSTRFLQLPFQCLAFHLLMKKRCCKNEFCNISREVYVGKRRFERPTPTSPNVVRYQLRYFPIAPAKLVIFGDMAKVFPYFFVFTSIVILGRWGSLVMSRMRGLPRWASELLVMLIFNLADAPGFNVPLERETLMPRL